VTLTVTVVGPEPFSVTEGLEKEHLELFSCCLGNVRLEEAGMRSGKFPCSSTTPSVGRLIDVVSELKNGSSIPSPLKSAATMPEAELLPVG
jgi:hypothetical protein